MKEIELKRVFLVVAFLALVSCGGPSKAREGHSAEPLPSPTGDPDAARQLARETHELYESSKKMSGDERVRRLEAAEKSCSNYLALFPATRNAYPIRMMLGETQYALGRLLGGKADRIAMFQSALETYLLVASAPDQFGNNEFQALAAENAIYAALEVVKLAGEAKRPTPGASSEALPFPDREVKRACEAYFRIVPNARLASSARYRAARFDYEFNRIDDAVAGLRAIVELHPDSPEARPAADLLITIEKSRSGAKAP